MKEFYIADDGIQLHAKLDVPEEKEKCPLVIVFHGLTGNMEERHITAVSNAMNEIGLRHCASNCTDMEKAVVPLNSII